MHVCRRPRRCDVALAHAKSRCHSTRAGQSLFFDLEKDPYELKSVYHDPAYASVVADIKKELKRLMDHYKDDGTSVVKFDNPDQPLQKAKGKAKAKLDAK